ncbi:hypothetical protein BYT27DRAFT_7213970 [Phlegmacium glaucopus]|nr:hypothetical protein BYT27DRAFT_7213970 [Phlegmacium glaucopus]
MSHGDVSSVNSLDIQLPSVKLPRKNCAGEHCSDKCNKVRGDYWCANCTCTKLKDGHAAWDRVCPRYLEESRRVRGRDPGSHYIYFPTEEEWTWKRRDEEPESVGMELGGLREGREEMGRGKRREEKGGYDCRADGGWAGMRELRVLEELVGELRGWGNLEGGGEGGSKAGSQEGSGVLGSQSVRKPRAGTGKSKAGVREPMPGQSQLKDFWAIGSSSRAAEEEQESIKSDTTNTQIY